MNPKVEFYFSTSNQWQEVIKQLRTIVLDCGLTEELKWGVPCYTFSQSNVVLIHVFKHYCALLFFKGALLSDTDDLLVQQTANVQAARQIRFTNLKDLLERKAKVIACIYEAIEIEKAGLKVDVKPTEAYSIPAEFEQKLHANAALKNAYEKLTPGRQRAYLLYFTAAKQAKTREQRVEKYIPKILVGKGLDD